jgi:hypothetical protein
MHASAGPHRPFNVRPAKRNGIQVDENMIDRTSGLNKDMEFDTELKIPDGRDSTRKSMMTRSTRPSILSEKELRNCQTNEKKSRKKPSQNG